MTDTTHEQYLKMVADAQEAARSYYQDGGLLMADADYDRLLGAIRSHEDAYPDDVITHGLFDTVAAGEADTGDVVHAAPMLSLDNCFDETALREWLTGRGASVFTTEPKYDGLSLAATYRDGRLVRIATRGDGVAGENVTHAAGRIAGLPENLTDTIDVEVRGEVIFTHTDYQNANDARVASGKKAFVNPRNAAAGTLRAETLEYPAQLSFFAHGQVGLTASSHSGAMMRLRELGVSTGSGELVVRTHDNVDDVLAAVRTFNDTRLDLAVDVDGMVVKCDRLEDQERLGFSSRAPKWGLAYKYPALEATSVLRSVEWTVGRTGRITPRASIDPVFVAGTTVSYATLHNAEDIKRKDLRIGDTVLVKRAGEVIPRIEAPIVEKRDGNEKTIDAPATCPRCDGPIDRSDLVWRCERGRSCGASEAVRYAASRDCLDIEGMGDRLVEQLVAGGLVNDVADLFDLTESQLAGLERMGETSARNVIAQIEGAKARSLSKVFCALGVRMTGRSMSRRLARHFLTMDALRAATLEELCQVEGVGVERATTIMNELIELGEVIDRLVKAGVTMTEPVSNEETTGNEVAGKTFVVTGAMSGALADLSRNDVHALIEEMGGKTSGSVSKKTDYLVCGESSGSKLDKATALGVRIVSPDELATMLGR
jgi:DNA ligase (NAD+)